MTFQPVDYTLVVLTVLMATFGLFRGVSGWFSILSALSLAVAGVFLAYDGFLSGVQPAWLAFVLASALFFVVFGVVRLCVKFTLGKLLAQPSDAIFGCGLGIFCGVMLLWGLSLHPALSAHSTLAQWLAEVSAQQG